MSLPYSTLYVVGSVAFVGTAMSVTADIVSAAAGQQYGGFSLPQIDEVFAPYAEKSYVFYMNQYKEIVENAGGTFDIKKADDYSYNRVKREAEQQYQHMEHTIN